MNPTPTFWFLIMWTETTNQNDREKAEDFVQIKSMNNDDCEGNTWLESYRTRWMSWDFSYVETEDTLQLEF